MTAKRLEDLNTLLDRLDDVGLPPDSAALGKFAETLGHIFEVDPDEIAILALNPVGKRLSFLIPERLAAVGSIPLSSTGSLAARTARERRAEVVNRFTSSRHATVFEGVPLGRDPDEIIQKIMSAPILNDSEVAGVVQVSRKGVSPTSAGGDFTQKDLGTLSSLSPALHRFIEICKKK